MQRIPRTKTDKRWADFRQFVCDVWKHLDLPEPTWVQLDICRWLAYPDAPKRFILEAFRGLGKSWLTVALVVWLLYWHPDWDILVVSASKAAADEFSTFTLRLIREMPGLDHMQPRDGQRDSKIAFDVAEAPAKKAPSVKSLGITSQLTGSRADIIIADDIEIPSNSLTPGMRLKLSDQVKEFDAILKTGAHCRVIFLGTPQCEQSIYNVLQTRGYQACIWPARFPDADARKEYGSRLAKSIRDKLQECGDALVGQPTDPTRFTDLDLRERELSYGKAGFAMQFQLRTTLSDLERYPLKVHDMILMDCDPVNGVEKPIWCNDPEHLDVTNAINMAMPGDWYYRPMTLVGKWIPYTGIVMSIDPAGRGKDETGYAVIAMLNGYLYVLACGGLQGGYDEHVLRRLSSIAKEWKVNHVVIEANFGDGMYTSLLKPVMAKYWSVTLEEVKHSIQKEKRICDTLEPVVQGHRLVLNASVVREDYDSLGMYGKETAYQHSLVYQLSRLTRERGALVHDDRLDALAIAVAYWVEEMAADADTEQQDFRAAALDKELEKFMDAVFGSHGVNREPIWTELMR